MVRNGSVEEREQRGTENSADKTVASGRCTYAQVPVPMAIGTKPTSAVMNTGRKESFRGAPWPMDHWARERSLLAD
jgi:hypothetical protein